MAGPTFELRFEGLDRLTTKLGQRPAQISEALEAALFVDAEQTMTEAKALVPVDEGVLRASGFVNLPERTPTSVVVEMGFGGPAGSGNMGESNPEDVGYAVYVHEDLAASHTVGQAKYLEAPLNRRRPGFAQRIVDRIKRRLGVV